QAQVERASAKVLSAKVRVPSRSTIAHLRDQALLFGAPAFGLFQRVAVFPLDAVAGSKIGLAIVVLPDFMVARLTRLAAQRVLLENVALLIAIHLDEPRLLEPVQAIGQNHQYLSLHNCYLHRTSTRRRFA